MLSQVPVLLALVAGIDVCLVMVRRTAAARVLSAVSFLLLLVAAWRTCS